MTSELRQPPHDAISRVVFSPVKTESLLLVSSWDSKVRLYDPSSNELKAVHEYSHPVLDCSFLRDSRCCVSGGLSKEVNFYDFDKGTATTLGTHTQAVRSVKFHPDTNVVFTGSWDGTVKSWDARAKSQVDEVKVDGKVFCMASSSTHLVVCDSSKRISVFDVRSLKLEQTRDHVLRYQYRDVCCFPDDQGFAVSSIEGRVAWEYFDETAKNKFAFKCHREKDGEGEKVYPVNALAFHPVHGTFATGGGDGVVSVWDGLSMKRLWRLPPFATSISSLAFSANGHQIAIGVSYDFSQGAKEKCPDNQIVIRQVKDEDVRPKNVSKTL